MQSRISSKEISSWKKFYRKDLQSVVLDFISKLEAPALLILDGDLGAGKTTFTKCFAQNYLSSSGDLFGLDDITSPSYSLINEIGTLAHADLYRIEDSQELVHLEMELYIEGKELFIVEWGMKYFDFLYSYIPDSWSIYIAKFQQNPLKEGEDQASRTLTLNLIL